MATAGLAALAACQPSAPVRIGFVGGLSEQVSELAIDGRNGAQLAIETLNARRGRRYELHLHDEVRSPAAAASAVEAFAAEGDAFVVGPMTSVVAAVMAPEASRHHVVMISPTANSDALSGIDDWFFRVIPPSGRGAELLADAVFARGLRSAALMADWRNRPYSERFDARFAERFQQLGGTPPQVVRYESDQNPDYAKIAAQLLATHPGLVLLVCSAVDAAIAAQQVRRLDAGVQIVMSSWAANEQLLQLGGRAVEGALVSQTLDLDSRVPAYVDFRRRFVERYGNQPSQAAVYAYDATLMGAEGLRRKTDGQSLRDALRAPGSWPGLQGPIVLDRFGDSVSPFRLSEVRQGRFVMLAP